MNTETHDTWLLKNPDLQGGCRSSLPFCGYDKDVLLQMIGKGYELFHNGEKVSVNEIKSAFKNAPAKSGRKFTKGSRDTR